MTEFPSRADTVLDGIDVSRQKAKFLAVGILQPLELGFAVVTTSKPDRLKTPKAYFSLQLHVHRGSGGISRWSLEATS